MNDKPAVLVLGIQGMLGSMVYHFLRHHTDFEVVGTSREADAMPPEVVSFDVDEFLQEPDPAFYLKSFDYVINCIGIIKPYCKDNDPAGVQRAIKVNATFPHVLAKYTETSSTKIIQIATDCVYSGKGGKYTEGNAHDALGVYGKTKSLGKIFYASNFLNIRCSFNHRSGIAGEIEFT